MACTLRSVRQVVTKTANGEVLARRVDVQNVTRGLISNRDGLGIISLV